MKTLTQSFARRKAIALKPAVRHGSIIDTESHSLSHKIKAKLSSISASFKDQAFFSGLFTQRELHQEITKVQSEALSTENLRSLLPSKTTDRRSLTNSKTKIPVVPDFPIELRELDEMKQKFQIEFDGINKDHPSFVDKEYRARREHIGSIALDYKMGQPIPNVEYTSEEDKLWKLIYTTLRPLLEANANQEYIQNLKFMEKEGVFRPEKVPQLDDINQFLIAQNNWRIKPVNGILSQRQFLNCLAFRTFPSSQYLRHTSRPFYTPEPDIFHEYLGHIPNFCDKDYCDISQLFGLLSLGADDHTIKVISSVYWYLIEFGTCFENGSMKFFGAGLAGSVDEIANFRNCRDFRKLDVSVAMPPPDFVVQDMQPFFYFIDKYSDYIEQMLTFAKTVKKPFEIVPNEDSTRMLIDQKLITFDSEASENLPN